MPFSSDMSVFCSTWWWITTWVVTSWLFSASLRTVYQRTWPDSTWRRWFWRSILYISCTMFTGETILLTDVAWFCWSFSLFLVSTAHHCDIWSKLHGNNLCVLVCGNVNSFGNTGSDQIVLNSAITEDIFVLPLPAQLVLRCIYAEHSSRDNARRRPASQMWLQWNWFILVLLIAGCCYGAEQRSMRTVCSLGTQIRTVITGLATPAVRDLFWTI